MRLKVNQSEHTVRCAAAAAAKEAVTAEVEVRPGHMLRKHELIARLVQSLTDEWEVNGEKEGLVTGRYGRSVSNLLTTAVGCGLTFSASQQFQCE